MGEDSNLVFLHPDSAEMGTESHSEAWPGAKKCNGLLALPKPLLVTERQYGKGRRKYSQHVIFQSASSDLQRSQQDYKNQ